MYRVSFYESHRGDEKPRKAYNSLKVKSKLKAVTLDLFMILTLVYEVRCQSVTTQRQISSEIENSLPGSQGP